MRRVLGLGASRSSRPARSDGADAYRAWRSTIGAEHPIIAFRVDPSKGSRWLAIPGNAEKVAEETARKLEKAENEVPLTLTPFEGVRSNLRL